LSKDVHKVLTIVKFYGDIDIKDFVDDLLKQALTSPGLLEKVLMDFLLNRRKVNALVEKLKKETFL